MSLIGKVKEWLEEPALIGLDLDDPRTTALRKDLIQNKAFLRKIYCDWYERMRQASQDLPEGRQLELGCGPGFLKELLPHAISSDLIMEASPDVICSGECLPFPNASLSAIFLLNVFHHIPQPRMLLAEAERSLVPGGKLLMVEPYNTPWGRFVWQRLHHEPFLPEATWESAGEGPLEGANGALPWIIFDRDRSLFEKSFPKLNVIRVKPFMPLAYLLSGGVSMRSLWPAWGYRPLRKVEGWLDALPGPIGLFAWIEIERRA